MISTDTTFACCFLSFIKHKPKSTRLELYSKYVCGCNVIDLLLDSMFVICSKVYVNIETFQDNEYVYNFICDKDRQIPSIVLTSW